MLQEIVDALSAKLGRPVLVDDPELRPIAYSTQFGTLDAVRTESILGRTAPAAAREALFGHGIGRAQKPVRIPAYPAIGMEARLCVPILRSGRRLGFLWLLEDRPLSDDEVALASRAAAESASVLQTEADTQLDRRKREQELLAGLLAGQKAAAAALEAAGYLPHRPLLVYAGSGPAIGDALERFLARVPVKHTLCGELDGLAVCVADAPARGAQLAEALGGDAAVGEGDAVTQLADVPRSYRRALAARRVAAERGEPLVRWDGLRAARLLAAMPASTLDDVPDGLRRLLEGDHDQLVKTLATYLDLAGDVKATSAQLWLHRTSLYYRLRRIEEIAGVDLGRGEDRLLCHVALRLARSAGD